MGSLSLPTLCRCLPLSVSVTFSLSLFITLNLSLSFYVTQFISPSLSVSLSLSLSVFQPSELFVSETVVIRNGDSRFLCSLKSFARISTIEIASSYSAASVITVSMSRFLVLLVHLSLCLYLPSFTTTKTL